MPTHLAFALAGALLASAPGSGKTAPPAERRGSAESFSIVAGRALGAAATCRQISSGRIDRDANRLGDVIERLAKDPAERSAAHRRLVESIGEGGDAVEQGALDCAQTRRALAEIERRLAK